MARVEQARMDVDEQSVHAFFESRARDAAPGDAMARTAFVGHDEAEARHAAELRAVLLPLRKAGSLERVLDIGCGGGRWAQTLISEIPGLTESYCGVDFSPSLIGLAKGLALGPAARFHVMSANALDPDRLTEGGRYSTALVIATSLYLNDAALARMLRSLPNLCRENALLYLREPVSVLGHRLTLVDEHSSNLNASYNAIYRTSDEYVDAITADGRFVMLESALLADPLFQRFPETRHAYFIARMRG